MTPERDDYWDWDRLTYGTCRVNCYPGGCTLRVYSKNGKVVREEIAATYPPFEDPDHRVPDYNPRGCQKGLQHSQAMYGADRIRYPMKRAGERGSGKWERLSWDQAFDEIGSKLADTIIEHGAESLIDDHSANGIGVMRGGGEATAPALMGLLGGTAFDLYFLTGDFNPGIYLTFGQFEAVSGIEDWFLPDTIILLSNPVYANIPDIHYFLEARYRGAKVVSICPDKNPTAQFADHWVPIDWSADPAFWLGVCKILVDEGWIDEDFMREQTDLPIAVRADDGRYLRASDLKAGGSDEQFFAIGTDGHIGEIPTGSLDPAFEYDLTGRATVTLADGSQVELTTVYNLLVERLTDYTPERVHEMAGVHPGQLREIAELCRPERKVFVFSNPNNGKLYHGDLNERSFCYMLALTGNIGRPGSGTRGMSAGFDFLASMPLVAMMPREILENPDPVGTALKLLLMLIDDYRERVKMDPSMPYTEAVFGALRELMKMAGSLAQPVHFWLNHAGYREVWDEHLDDPDAKRSIGEYADAAVEAGWTEPWDRPAKDVQPRAMFVSGSNPVRRHRGRNYLEQIWPKLDLIFTADTRWSTTALLSDYVLPAASYYEYADTKYTTAHTRFVMLTDGAVPMLEDSKSDRMIVLGILAAVERNLLARGVENYFVGGREIVVNELTWRATVGGRYGDTDEDEQRLVDDALKSLSRMGWIEGVDGSTDVGLEKLREDGMAWSVGRPPWQATAALNTDQIAGEVLYPFRDQIEQKIPYKTTSRRIQFYADHPWFVEADEALVRFKKPPAIGGRRHPLRMTGGHVRWSIHGVWHTSEEMLKLHRGEPFAFINDQEAAAKGVADGDFIRVFNDYDDFLTRAKVSACVRPDQLVIYHAWEPYQHPGWKSQDRLLPGPPKGLHFAGGYRHFEYSLWSWSPSQSDRQTNVDYEKAPAGAPARIQGV